MNEPDENLASEDMDGSSIFNKFKMKFGEVNRKEFMKMDSGVNSELENRNGLIMTPKTQIYIGQMRENPR